MYRKMQIPEAPGGYHFDGVSQFYGPCVCCGRDVKNPAVFVHDIEGGGVMLHRDDEALYQETGDLRGDVGLQPVGARCVKLIPKEYRYRR